MTHVLILFVTLGIYCALAEKSEFPMTTELSKKHSADSEDKLLENITRAKNSSQHILDDNSDEERKTDKKPRTFIHRDSSPDRDKSTSSNFCCGRRYSTNESARPDYNYNKPPSEVGRYPSQYNERNPVDRFGWQTQSRPSGSGNGGRPGEGGSGTYAGSQSADRYPSRPVYGSESANRPSALGYGSGTSGGYSYGVSGHGGYGGRPSGYGGSNGGYGISGTLADGDEFGPGDSAYPDGSLPQHPGNLHAQKAVALKALAGVALIGAAAALASNPVLLPIGIVGGRRKRSETSVESEEMQYNHPDQSDDQMDYIMNMLKRNLYKIQKDSSTNRLIVSPRCVARLTCEIQKDYLSDIDKDVEILNTQNRKYHLTDLIRNNVLNAASVNSNVKDLIKMAIDVATENRNCKMFACSYIRKG